MASAKPARRATREGFVRVEGGLVWYRIVGRARATPLMTLHGGPGFPSDYLEPLAALADERQVVFYDQLGCGRSDRPSDKRLWRAARFVTELAQVRRALGLERVHILGHSWGTQLATDYLLTRPRGVVSAIMASPAISIPQWVRDANRLRAQLPRRIRETLRVHEKSDSTGCAEYAAATLAFYKRHVLRLEPWPEVFERTQKAAGLEVYNTMWGPNEFNAAGNLRRFDRTARLRELKLPMLFTCGRYDEATPEATARYSRAVRGSEMVVFPGCSHLVHLENPTGYVRVVRDFLRRADRAAAPAS
jgi:proline iminopeptidase